MSCRSARLIFSSMLCVLILLGLSRIANAQLFSRLAYSPVSTSSAYSFLKDNSVYYAAEYNSDFKKIFSAGENTKIIILRLSPNGKYIAVIAEDMGRKYPYVDLPGDFRNGMVALILDTKGDILIKLEPDDLKALDWNPEGNKFLCLTGDYKKNPVRTEWRPGDVLSIYDADSKEKISSHVAQQNEYYWNAAWAKHDGNIYINMGIKQDNGTYDGVFRYEYKTSELSPTPFKTITISSDGKYCFKDRDYESGIGLYSTSTGKEIPLVVPDKILRLDYLKRKDSNSYYQYFTGNLKCLSWINEDGKTYLLLYDVGSSGLHEKMGISGFWKVDCETGISEEMAAPKGISTYISKETTDYQMPAGLANGKLVWPVSDGKGGLKASTLEQ